MISFSTILNKNRLGDVIYPGKYNSDWTSTARDVFSFREPSRILHDIVCPTAFQLFKQVFPMTSPFSHIVFTFLGQLDEFLLWLRSDYILPSASFLLPFRQHVWQLVCAINILSNGIDSFLRRNLFSCSFLRVLKIYEGIFLDVIIGLSFSFDSSFIGIDWNTNKFFWGIVVTERMPVFLVGFVLIFSAIKYFFVSLMITYDPLPLQTTPNRIHFQVISIWSYVWRYLSLPNVYFGRAETFVLSYW